MSQQFCLKWNNHMNNMMDVFKNLLSTEAMVDVTLACDGLSLKAHKIVLSACSPFFQSLFLENPCKHPIVILKDMKYTELKAIIEFMYHGEVNVAQDQLSALMKTAETLRVKGLAEVTNEKQSNSQDDSSQHRSVPRTDTPPPSKRRRGRTRKRSLSDQSDDDVSEPKIKQPDSDIEELSGDMDASSSQYSVPSTVPMQTISSHSTNSFHKQSQQQQEQPVDQGADESFAPEEKFGVEPSKLLEQTLTTDDLPRRSGRSSVQSNMSNMEMQRRPRSSTDHSSSTSLAPTSMPSDALVPANQQPESPPDIKPELLELDPPMSPVAGPSHSTDENSMMMYMDQSSMSGMPGPSGYQDNSALVSTDSQPQELFKCDICTRVFTVEQAMLKHRQRHKPEGKRHSCKICPYSTKYSSHLRQHMFTHSGERPFKCTKCPSGFTQNFLLRKHMKTHEPKTETSESKQNDSKKDSPVQKHESEKETSVMKNNKSRTEDNELKKNEPKKETNVAKNDNSKTEVNDFKKQELKNDTKETKQESKTETKDSKQESKKETKETTKQKSERENNVLKKEKHDFQKKDTKDLKMNESKTETKDSMKIEYKTECKKLKCERCSKSFEEEKLFSKHMRIHKREDKPYKCRTCFKRFPKESILKKHEKRHEKKSVDSVSSDEDS